MVAIMIHGNHGKHDNYGNYHGDHDNYHGNHGTSQHTLYDYLGSENLPILIC